jgi:Skp family chaperone for outer membrane proteins
MLKKVIIGLQVVILIAMGFLFYKAYQPAAPEKYVFNDKGKAVEKVTENDVIVYYKLDAFLTKSNYIDSIKKAGNRIKESYEGNLRRLEENYNKLNYDFGVKAQAKQLTALEEKNAADLLRAKAEEFQREEERAQFELMKLQEKVGKNINDAILKTINELNTKRKIKFVLAYTETSQEVMPTKGAIDVTNDMIEIINNLYKTKR